MWKIPYETQYFTLPLAEIASKGEGFIVFFDEQKTIAPLLSAC